MARPADGEPVVTSIFAPLRHLSPVLALAFLLPPIVAAPAEPQASPEIAKGRELTQLFYRGELSKVHGEFSREFKEAMSLETLRAHRVKLSNQLGVEKLLLDERIETAGDYRVYLRKCRFEKSEEDILVQWWFRDDGKLGAFRVQPSQIREIKKIPPPSRPASSGDGSPG